MASLLGPALRQPKAEAPVAYVASRAGMFGGTGSINGQPLAKMSQVGTLFAIVDRICTAVIAPDWHLYRQPKNGQAPDEREIVDPAKHAAAHLWANPNPHMSQADILEMGQQHEDLAGDAFLVVVKRGSIPLELWPVRPDRMLEVPHPTKYLAGWIYRSPDGDKIPLAVDEVIHLKGTPNPENPYRGMGRVQALMRDLEGSVAAAEWNANFFRNSAIPGGIVEVPNRLNDDEFDELRMRWNEQHRGVSNAHRVAILEHGTFRDRGYSMRDLEFSALRNLSRDQIMEAFGVSRATMGLTDGVNYAAAKAARVQFAELIVEPRLERWKQTLNARLLPMFGATGKGVTFDCDSPVPSDVDEENAERTSRVAAAVAILSIPSVKFDPKATLEAFGLPDLPFEEVEPPAPVIAPPLPPEPVEVDELPDDEPDDRPQNRRPVIVNSAFDRQQDLDWGLFG